MKKFTVLTLILFLINVVCFAQMKNYKVESTANIPSNKTQDEIVSGLIQSLTRQAIEKSGIKLNDYNLSEREYNEFVKSVPKIEVKNKKVFMKKDNLQCVNIQLNVKMDSEIAKAYLYKIKNVRGINEKQSKIKQEKAIKKEVDLNSVAIGTTDKIKTEISKPTVKTVNNAKEAASLKRISVNQALQEAKITKQRVNKLLEEFDNSLKESDEEITKDYDGKISKINLNVKKDQWETTEQYNEKIEKLKQEKQILEQQKDKAVSENKVKIAQMAVTTLQPQIDNLKSFQTKKFCDENSAKAKIISLGEVNADEKYFLIKILYENEQSIISNLKYDFSDINIEQAKEMYNNFGNFVIEPLFSVEENSETGELQKVLTAFGIKYSGFEKEKIVNLSTKAKPFKEYVGFEKFSNVVNK